MAHGTLRQMDALWGYEKIGDRRDDPMCESPRHDGPPAPAEYRHCLVYPALRAAGVYDHFHMWVVCAPCHGLTLLDYEFTINPEARKG